MSSYSAFISAIALQCSAVIECAEVQEFMDMAQGMEIKSIMQILSSCSCSKMSKALLMTVTVLSEKHETQTSGNLTHTLPGVDGAVEFLLLGLRLPWEPVSSAGSSSIPAWRKIMI